MVKLAVFYHCAHIGMQWQQVDEQIMRLLRSSTLMARADVFVCNHCNDVGLFEFPTLNMVRNFCEQYPEYYVLYLHTKGVTHINNPGIDDWRECMLYWMVERWPECVSKLAEGYDAVGINYIDTPVPHYQGNFWWATAKHVRTLSAIEDVQYVPTHTNQTERHKAEFWLLGKPGVRHYQPYHHKVNPYLARNPRAKYCGRRF